MSMTSRFPLTTLVGLFISHSICFADTPKTDGIPVVRVTVAAGEYSLVRNGQPYFIKGVGGDGSRKLLVQSGGNSIRTWGADNLQQVLDEAQQLGLSVTVGFWLGHERHGFNYNDAEQVSAQTEQVQKTVEKFKRHPAVLIWALGNEMEGTGENAAIWLAINHLAILVKRIDPNHPTMTVVAEIGGNKVKNVHRFCPDIDILGINSYAGAASVPKRYREAGGTKPYILTEFGPAGTWESAKNSWGLVPEKTSTEKADSPTARHIRQAVAAAEREMSRFVRVFVGDQARGDRDVVWHIAARWNSIGRRRCPDRDVDG